MFFLLGLTNARRNLGRSLVAVLSMAFAALILSSSLSLSTGHPAGSYRNIRMVMGGEISVFGPRFALSQADLEGRGKSPALSHQFINRDVRSDLAYLEPEIYSEGYLSPAGAISDSTVPSSPRLDMDSLTRRLKDIPGVAAVHPVEIYPSLMEADVKIRTGGTVRNTFSTPLRGRDIASDLQDPGYEGFVVAGRGLEPADDGALVALADAHRADAGYPDIPPGSKVTLKIPKVRRGVDGGAVFDYTDYTTFEFTVVGQYALPTRTVAWLAAGPGGSEEMKSEDLFWTTPYLMVPQATLRKIFAQLGGEGMAFPVYQAGISVPDTTRLNVTLRAVRAALPEHTTVGTAALLSKAQSGALPEPVKEAPMGVVGDPSYQRVGGEPVDLGRLIPILVYLIAALLVAANMLVIIARRRREIGILKALGARGWDVAAMVLTEVMALSSTGALVGFAIVRFAATWTMISNKVPISRIGLATLSDLGQVLGLTVGAAIIFGLAPAVAFARLPAMEVLRHE